MDRLEGRSKGGKEGRREGRREGRNERGYGRKESCEVFFLGCGYACQPADERISQTLKFPRKIVPPTVPQPHHTRSTPTII